MLLGRNPLARRRSGPFFALLAAVALSSTTVAPAAASERSVGKPSDGTASSPPVAIEADIASLVPVSVPLSTPMLCGAITVYDQEDVGTLCGPLTLASRPIVGATCPQFVSGSVRLETDLVCTDETALIVASDNTIIDLNGHRIECRGSGYQASCQGNQLVLNEPDVGVDTNNFDNVHVFSHVDGGTIDGFDVGVLVRPESDNVKVKQLIITGPPAAPPAVRPRGVRGVEVDGSSCGRGNVRIGGGTATSNEISNHSQGIVLLQAACVYVGYNQVHDNRQAGDPAFVSAGILLSESPNNHIRSNLVADNGDDERGNPPDSGILLDTTSTILNLVVENQSNVNHGSGIASTRSAGGNDIVNNQMLTNSHVDAYSDQTGSPDRWNKNNRCVTQTEPEPPPGVCGTNEAPPPQ